MGGIITNQAFKNKLIKVFGKNKYYNGERDFINGYVEHLFRDGDTLFAVVIGHTFTRKHNVKISIKDIAQNVCSCSSGGFCRHVVATLLAYHSSREDTLLLENYIDKITTLPERELKELLRNIITENPKITLNINFFLELNRLNTNNYSEVIKNILDLALDEIEINDYNAEVIYKRIKQLLRQVKRKIEPANDPKITFESYFYICKRIVEFMHFSSPRYLLDYIDLIRDYLVEPVLTSIKKADQEHINKYVKDIAKISVYDFVKGRTGVYKLIEYATNPRNYRNLLATYMKWLSKRTHLGEWMYFHNNTTYTEIARYILNTLYTLAEKGNITKEDILEYFSKISKSRGFYIYLKIFELLLEEEKNIELALFFAERIVLMWFPDALNIKEKEFKELQYFLIELMKIQPNRLKGYKIEQFLLNLMDNQNFLRFLDENETLRANLKKYISALDYALNDI